MTLSAEQRIERCHIDLMKHPNFVAYSGVLMIGNVSVKDDTPTAYTNGRDVVYGRKFVESLNDSELRGLILHENKHKMYRHMLTWYHLFKQNAGKCNMACDYVINLEIADEGKDTQKFISLPKGGLFDEKFRGLNSAEVFNLLPDDDGGNGRGGKGGLDEHGWDDAQTLTETERGELAKEIDQAIRQGAILAGKTGGSLNRSFDDLLKAKVDWREALREFVSSVCAGKDQCTWRKPNRRWLQQDIYLPTTYSEAVGRVVVAIDTSGSIGGAILTRFMSELTGIMENVNPEQIDLLYWDAEVAGHEVYGQGDVEKMKSSTKVVGGGGTVPSCITKYMREHKIEPVCAIVLTDGCVGNDWGGAWNCPVLWCIVDNDNVRPSVGQAIKIEM